MAQPTWLCGLSLEMVNHGIYVRRPDQEVGRHDRQDIQVASLKEISKEIHSSYVLLALCH